MTVAPPLPPSEMYNVLYKRMRKNDKEHVVGVKEDVVGEKRKSKERKQQVLKIVVAAI